MKPVFLFICGMLLTCGLRAEEVIDVDSRRELFVDDLLIGGLNGTQLKLHAPQKLRNLPARPFGHYATVLQDGDRLRLHYQSDRVPGAHWRDGWGRYHTGEVTLYAESTDGGRHWVEPQLGLYDLLEFPVPDACFVRRHFSL